MKHAAMKQPIQTHIHACHHERPLPVIITEAIIQVLILKESAIQKKTKFRAPHWRRSDSTGFKSWFVSIDRPVLRSSPDEISNFLSKRLPREEKDCFVGFRDRWGRVC